MSLFQASDITTSDLGKRTSFEVACQIPTMSDADKTSTNVYACSYGINELLTSSFKLHDPDKPEVVDPWEALMAELTFLFGAPMIVVKAKGEGGYFIRSSVTDEECFHLRGVKRGRPGGDGKVDALLPREVREELDAFYELHASVGASRPGPPLALYCSCDPAVDGAFEVARAEYDGLLEELKEHRDGGSRYIASSIKNPSLLDIREIAALALYHVHPHRKNEITFVGVVEIYLPLVARDETDEGMSGSDDTPSPISWIDPDLIARLALTLSVSVNKLRPIDFRSYLESPAVPVEDLPSFREYGKDLDKFMDLVLSRRGERIPMATDSSLPEVFDDLYLQIRRLLELYTDQPESISVAFVVPAVPDGRGNSVGRYYFPPQFIREVFESCDDPQQVRSAIDVLKVSNASREVGLPLDLGVIGYMRQTAFPAVLMHDLKEDARPLSYDNKLQEQEFTLFFRGRRGRTPRVIEFPLVLFAGQRGGAVYPTALIIFLNDLKEPLPFRTFHHLYALACDARYTLSKAFAAEVYREDQVERLSTVVHDVDRMCRPFASGIQDMKKLADRLGEDAVEPDKREFLRKLDTTAQVVQDVLQFAQWLANPRATEEPTPETWRPVALEKSLHEFLEMFTCIWPPGVTWPGWAELQLLWGDSRVYKTKPAFRWPHGALYTILWNLSANAVRKYREMEGGVATDLINLTSLSCRVENPELVRVEGASANRRLPFATFELAFPGIDFWDSSLAGADLGESEHCVREGRHSCESMRQEEFDCDTIDVCGSYLHAKFFTSAHSSSKGQGLRSCRQALEEWYRMFKLLERPSIEVIKAGRPVRVRFRAPLIVAN